MTVSRRLASVAKLRELAAYIKPYRWFVSALFACLLAETAFEITVRYSVRIVIDDAITPRDVEMLIRLVTALGAGGVVYIGFCLFTDYVWARISLLMIRDMRSVMFAHMQTLPVGFFTHVAAGDLSQRFTADASRVEEGMLFGVPMGLLGILEVLVSLALMAQMSGWLLAVGAIGLAASFVLPNVLNVRALRAHYAFRNELGSLSGFVQQNIVGQSLVKTYNLDAKAQSDFRQRADRIVTTGVKSYFGSFLVQRTPSLLFLIVSVAMLGAGAILTMNGRLSIGEFVAVQTLFAGLSSGVGSVAWLLSSVIDTAAAYERMRDVLDATPDHPDPPGAVTLARLADQIEFDHVVYRQGRRHSAELFGISATIRAGQYVAVVGTSGAGKTTLVNLLLRLLEPQEGRILWDGVDIAAASRRSLREQIAIVHQDVIVFDATLAENIRLGRLDATDDEVAVAAAVAQLTGLVKSLPDGLATRCGEGGRSLSGGERQRLALARALVRRPAVLVLDEATASIDPANEAAFLRALQPLRGKVTIITVTHRIFMAREADLVLVMSGGRLVEAGRHHELLGLDGHYAALWQSRENATKERPADAKT